LTASIKHSERLFLLSVVFLFVSFVIVSKLTSFRKWEVLDQSEESLLSNISLEITGAVYKPGVYQVASGTPLAVVLNKARVKPFADLSNLEAVLIEQSGEIEIPFLKEIGIEVLGCVERTHHLSLPAGSRICDLKKLLSVTKEADLSFFKKKRILKNNEVITIPAKR
jgi:hypothetical protein